LTDTEKFFTEEEIDALQELMNIAFGQAAAELAEIINISVELSFPDLKAVKVSELPEFIKNNIDNFTKCNIVEQSFRGAAAGVAYLFFPAGSEKEFVSLFHHDGDSADYDLLIDIEREVLSEVGNILIGACVSKIFDLLKTPVTYTPPHTVLGQRFEDHFIKGRFADKDFAIMLKTNFSLSERSVSGYLFLINCQSAVKPLKESLAKLFESYE